MSERPSPELQALAAELFAAGRAERPGPALGRRLALIDPRYARQPAARIDSAIDAAAARRRLPARLVRGLSLTALVAGSVGLWWVAQAGDTVLISAEHTPEHPRSASAPQSPAPPAPVPPQLDVANVISPSPAAALPAALAPPAATAQPTPGVSPPVRSVLPSAGDARAPSRAREPRAAAGPRAARRASTTEATPIHPLSPAGSSGSSAGLSVSLARPPDAANPPSAPPTSLRRELELLERARAALRTGEPRQALDLLATHARERSGGALVAEATLLRIEALAALGERSAATDLARRFVNDNPHSALSDRARSFIDVTKTAAP